MIVIKVPALDLKQSGYDPNRPISSLLKTQVEHLHVAEKRLPSRYHSEIYVNAIRTEGEAANYIRTVTEAIHAAHKEAAAQRAAPARKRGIEIAAVADVRSGRQRKPRAVKKKGKLAKGRGKA
jgi:hypothetical protein